MRARYLSMLVISIALSACGPVEDGSTGDNSAQVNNSAANNASACMGGKCDIPTDDEDYDWESTCLDRRLDVLSGNRETSSPDFLRWPCADVSGVNARNSDDRGQEYCEYFALVQLPDLEADDLAGEVVDLGRIVGEEQAEDRWRPVTTPLELELTDDQFDWYDDNYDEVVGHCVFTSWHEDFPAMACEDDGTCPVVLGDVAVNAEQFRMRVAINSNFAARDLLTGCIRDAASGDYGPINDSPELLDDAFMRGCSLADKLYTTGWRFSDSSVCAVGARLAECGCGLEGVETIEEVAEQLIPSPEAQIAAGEVSLRGFPLGGWAGLDELPTGCDYVETGDAARTLVVCDIYASDLLDNLRDPKGFCQDRYGDNVVVHVPLPAAQIVCEPPEDGTYSATCGEQPWVLEAGGE